MNVTNNKLIKDVDIWVDGDYRSVLLKVRDLVYEGHELLTHPLGASIRMIFSPVRTIVLSDHKIPLADNEYSMQLIGEAIIKYDNLMGRRKPDLANQDDYSYVDMNLHDQAMKELGKLA